jgi:hypothetical protein
MRRITMTLVTASDGSATVYSPAISGKVLFDHLCERWGDPVHQRRRHHRHV